MYVAIPSCRVNSSAPLVCRHDQGPGSRGADGAYAHPTLVVLTQLLGQQNRFCKQINKQQYKCTTLVLLYKSVDLFAKNFFYCIAYVYV